MDSNTTPVLTSQTAVMIGLPVIFCCINIKKLTRHLEYLSVLTEGGAEISNKLSVQSMQMVTIVKSRATAP